MTTILGIKTNDGLEEGIILAADTQLNFYEGSTHTKKKKCLNYTVIAKKNRGPLPFLVAQTNT